MKYLAVLFFLVSHLVIISCGDDIADCTSDSFVSEINMAVDDYNDAASTWLADPSESNCNAWKDLAEDYIKIVEDLEGCPEISQTDYDAALTGARNALNAINCN